MTEQEKAVLLSDLSARLPYGLTVIHGGNAHTLTAVDSYNECYLDDGSIEPYDIEDIKPVLRPLSSITKQEYLADIKSFSNQLAEVTDFTAKLQLARKISEWLYANHFDVCGLIDKGYAISLADIK